MAGLSLEFLLRGPQGHRCPSRVTPWAVLWGHPQSNPLSNPMPFHWTRPCKHECLSGAKHAAVPLPLCCLSAFFLLLGLLLITGLPPPTPGSQRVFYFCNLKMNKESVFSSLMHKMNFLNSSSSRKRSCWVSPVCVSVYTRLRNSVCTHRCRAPSLRKPLLLLRVSSDTEVAMVSISVLLVVLGKKHPKWAYCNLENSLGTFKALDQNIHFFKRRQWQHIGCHFLNTSLWKDSSISGSLFLFS